MAHFFLSGVLGPLRNGIKLRRVILILDDLVGFFQPSNIPGQRNSTEQYPATRSEDAPAVS